MALRPCPVLLQSVYPSDQHISSIASLQACESQRGKIRMNFLLLFLAIPISSYLQFGCSFTDVISQWKKDYSKGHKNVKEKIKSSLNRYLNCHLAVLGSSCR